LAQAFLFKRAVGRLLEKRTMASSKNMKWSTCPMSDDDFPPMPNNKKVMDSWDDDTSEDEQVVLSKNTKDSTNLLPNDKKVIDSWDDSDGEKAAEIEESEEDCEDDEEEAEEEEAEEDEAEEEEAEEDEAEEETEEEKWKSNGWIDPNDWYNPEYWKKYENSTSNSTDKDEKKDTKDDDGWILKTGRKKKDWIPQQTRPNFREISPKSISSSSTSFNIGLSKLVLPDEKNVLKKIAVICGSNDTTSEKQVLLLLENFKKMYDPSKNSDLLVQILLCIGVQQEGKNSNRSIVFAPFKEDVHVQFAQFSMQKNWMNKKIDWFDAKRNGGIIINEDIYKNYCKPAFDELAKIFGKIIPEFQTWKYQRFSVIEQTKTNAYGSIDYIKWSVDLNQAEYDLPKFLYTSVLYLIFFCSSHYQVKYSREKLDGKKMAIESKSIIWMILLGLIDQIDEKIEYDKDKMNKMNKNLWWFSKIRS